MAQPEHFPPLFVGIVQAAEGASDLPASLGRYVGYETRLAALRHKMISAAIYPCVLLGAGGSVALFLLGYVVPRFAAVYQGSGQDDAASLRHAAETLDLRSGFVLYGYVYDADELLALAEDTLDVASATLLTDVAQCPVYYITLK